MLKPIRDALNSIRDYVEQYPIIFMSIMFGFALSYRSLFTHGATYFHLFLVINSLVSLIFLTCLTKYFGKLSKHKGDKFSKKFSVMNTFLLFYLVMVSNGVVLFLDSANFKINHGSKYAAFKEKMGRHGVREEAMYHAIFTLVLIILTFIFYSLNSYFNHIIIDSLFRLSLWSMFWSVIPVAGIFSFFTMNLAGQAAKFTRLKLEFRHSPASTGGTVFFVGQRRIWSFFAAFAIFFSIMIWNGVGVFNSTITSLIVALLTFILWLVYYEFGMKSTSPIK